MKRRLKRRNPISKKRIDLRLIRHLQKQLRVLIKHQQLNQGQVAKLAHLPAQVISRDLGSPHATLRALAAIGHALGYKIQVRFVKR